MKLLRPFIFFAALATLAACNLEKEVDIVLPQYDRQPVVECYLEPGKPFRLLLTSSYSFFDPFGLDSNFLQKTLLQGATVTISYDGQVETLQNFPVIETNPFKIYNYTSQSIVPATPGIEFTLNITLLVDQNAGEIGHITEVLEMPQQEMAAVQYQGREVLIPLNEQFIIEVDHATQKVLMDLPEGLLNL